ncbi:MAG TPA: Ku protein [Fimbriimonadales bacterium]|jgi:DNA end-binding protein Ku|nr:Ku protein [Fimbriimonadales bacterium]
MARPLWNGVVSFGMVSIPVKLYTGTSDNDISFNLLHDECKSRVKQLRWCPVHDKEVPWDELVRGYEYSKGRYVVLSDEDFESLPVPSKHTIEITKFVPLDDIDPVYFDKAYYLEPEEVGIKPYSLFMKSLTEKGMVGIGKIAIRQKEHICSLRAVKGTLVLETLYYADEVRVDLDKSLPETKISAQEMKMAETLIDLLKGEFDPKEYHDEYRAALMERIEAKLSGQEIVEAPVPQEAQITDLMEALKASVEAAKHPKEKKAAS